MAIFLPLDTQAQIFLYLRILLCFSAVLHIIALLCLFKQTPPNQATVRKYLIYIQVLLVLSDFHMGILFEPIPLFPVLAGYCIGVACQLGVPVQVETGVTVLLIANVGISVLLCVIFRHQSLLQDNHRLKMRKRVARAIHWSLLVGFSVPPILYASALQDPAESERLLGEHPDLAWIRDRGPWLVQVRSAGLTTFFVAIVVIVLIGFSAGAVLFVHMFYILKADFSKRSALSSAMIKKSLVMMCIQLVIPLILLVLPAGVIYVGLAVEDLITFETSFAAFLVIHLHPIGHNIILLSVTSTYRNFISRFVRRHVLRQDITASTAARKQTAPSRTISLGLRSSFIALSATARAAIFRYLNQENFDAEVNAHLYLALAVHELYMNGAEKLRITADNMTDAEKDAARTYVRAYQQRRSIKWPRAVRDGDTKKAHLGLVTFRAEILPQFLALFPDDANRALALAVIDHHLGMEEFFATMVGWHSADREYFEGMPVAYGEVPNEYALTD